MLSIELRQGGNTVYIVGQTDSIAQAGRLLEDAKRSALYSDKKAPDGYWVVGLNDVIVRVFDEKGLDRTEDVEDWSWNNRQSSILLDRVDRVDEFAIERTDRYEIVVVAGKYGEAYVIDVGWVPAGTESGDVSKNFTTIGTLIFDPNQMPIPKDQNPSHYAWSVMKRALDQIRGQEVSGYAYPQNKFTQPTTARKAKQYDEKQKNQQSAKVQWVQGWLQDWEAYLGELEKQSTEERYRMVNKEQLRQTATLRQARQELQEMVRSAETSQKERDALKVVLKHLEKVPLR